jgi:hypothetical protein
MKRYHIGYYLAEDKKVISGLTLIAPDIFEAISQYINTGKRIELVKYIVEMDSNVDGNEHRI